MIGYLLRRLLQLVPVLLGISVLAFLFLHALPGDPARTMLGPRAPAAQVEALRHELGLDRSLPVQFGDFLVRLAHGDLGRSIRRREPVTSELARTFPATLELATAAMAIALVVGVPLGIAAALKRGTWVDGVCTALSLAGTSIPIFWLGLMLLLVFSSELRWLPFGGRAEVPFPVVTGFYTLDSLLSGNPAAVADVWAHLALPALTLSSVPLAIVARMTRSSLLETLDQDYVRTAVAKGLTPRQAVLRHAFRNALLPVVTVTGLEFGYLLGGAVLTETVFQWPGLGRLIVEAVFSRDYPVVQGGVLVAAAAFALVNLLVDLLYGFLDPRVRYD